MLLNVFLFNSCDTNKDPEPLPCLFTSQVTTSGGYTYTYNLTYDNQKVISTTSTSKAPDGSTASSTGTFTYNDAGNISGISYSAGYREVYTYTNGEITKKEKFNNSNVLTDQTDYEYANGQLIKIQEYSMAFGTTGLAKEAFQTIEYASTSDKDPLRSKFYYSITDTTPYSTSEFFYGDKKSALRDASPAMIKYFRLGGNPTDKAVTKIIAGANGTQTIIYTYEFNADDYPTKRIETYSPGSIVNTVVYTYNCN